jgi:RNA polymerase sporulation-specific sigma factor
MYLRSISKRRNEVSLQDPIGVDKEGNETTYQDIIGTDAEAVVDMVEHNIETKRMYSKFNAALKGREKSIIALRYGLFNKPARTQSEIAGIFGISRSYVSRIEKKAIQKLFKELNQEA